MKKHYTREQKIKYWLDKIHYAQERIKYLESDDYQDWTETISEQIKALKAKIAAKQAAEKKGSR